MKKGFTLAEVLISLTIVGIISLLTLPSLIGSYKTKMYTAQLQKVYSQLSTAIEQVISDEHADNVNSEKEDMLTGFYATSVCDNPTSFFNYMKKTKTCNSASCLASSYKKPDGTSLGAPVVSDCIKTSSGAAVCMKYESGATVFIVDVNGAKDPNMTGLDTFVMQVADNGALVDKQNDPDKCNSGSGSVESAAAGCIAKVSKNGWSVKND